MSARAVPTDEPATPKGTVAGAVVAPGAGALIALGSLVLIAVVVLVGRLVRQRRPAPPGSAGDRPVRPDHRRRRGAC